MKNEFQKATITILAGSNRDTELEVLFNPAEYTHERSNNFQETSLPGLANPVLQFVNGQTQSVSMELFFDTWTNTDQGDDASEMTAEFMDLLSIDSDLHAPPPVRFEWGTFSFTAVIESISQKFTMFRSDGTPVRATLNVTFKQYRPIREQLQEPRLNSSDKTKRRVTTGGDSLWALANSEYHDVRHWRKIAKHNRIEFPRLVAPGTYLTLPPLEASDELDPL